MNETPSTMTPDPEADGQMSTSELFMYFLIVTAFAIGISVLVTWTGSQADEVLSNVAEYF